MNSTENLIQSDYRHMIHPHLPASQKTRVIFKRGKDCNLWDVEGNQYLDATGGLWLAQIGHGREEIAAAAARQIRELEYATCFWEYSHERAIELAEKLATLAPAGLDKVLFTSGGSEGDDAAIKAARFYHAQRGQPTRTWILSRKTAYHGAAYGGGTATGFPEARVGTGPDLPHVAYLTPPHAYRNYLFEDQACTDFCIAELEKAIHDIGAENIAAMIGEPIMGVGGMVPPPMDYWPRVSAVLKKHGILLISDEVVTAFGRSGNWFAAERYGVTPDIMVTAKGISSGYIPLGAVLMSREIGEVTTRDHGFPMGYTYCGHPVACAVALENIRILEEEKLVDRSNVIGNYLAKQLSMRLHDNPRVGEIRQAGMAIGIELVTDKASRQPLPLAALQIADYIRREKSVIARICNYSSLCLSPPLIMSKSEADQVAEAVSDVLARVRANGVVE